MEILVSHRVIVKTINNFYPISSKIPVEIPFFFLETQRYNLGASRRGMQGRDSAEASTGFQS